MVSPLAGEAAVRPLGQPVSAATFERGQTTKEVRSVRRGDRQKGGGEGQRACFRTPLVMVLPRAPPHRPGRAGTMGKEGPKANSTLGPSGPRPFPQCSADHGWPPDHRPCRRQQQSGCPLLGARAAAAILRPLHPRGEFVQAIAIRHSTDECQTRQPCFGGRKGREVDFRPATLRFCSWSGLFEPIRPTATEESVRKNSLLRTAE